MKNTDIEDIIAEQNLPTPVEGSAKLKPMLPMQYPAAAAYYFIYSQAVQERPMSNKPVAKKFNLALSSLHHITSRWCYAGGSASQKLGKWEHAETTV